MNDSCKQAFHVYVDAKGYADWHTFEASWIAALDAVKPELQAGIAAYIRSKLETYHLAHDATMQQIRACNYATDICTLAATGSRQLAVVQCLETILFDLTGQE